MANPTSKQTLFEIPPQTKEAILNLIAASSEPVKPASLIKSAGLPKKVTAKALHASLEPEIESGRIADWGTKTTHLYWHRNREAEARQRLLSNAATAVMDAAALTARVSAGQPKLTKPLLTTVLKQLEKEGRLRLVTATHSKKPQVVDVEHPELHLIAEVQRLLESFNRGQLVNPIVALLTGKQPSEPPTPVPGAEAPESAISEVAEKMFEAINRIAFSPGTTVTFYRLRQQPELAPVPKEIFDQAALLLERERKALLSLHDHAAALPQEEQNQLVTDGLGTYYVSIYAR